MSKGPTVLLDTCYDFSGYESVDVPKISFIFSGDVEVPIPLVGTLFDDSDSHICLAFVANHDDRDIAIFGNMQQKTLQVVYDGAGGKVGFSVDGCQ